MSNTFTMQIEVTDEFLADCLVTAIEGGIGYWSQVITYTWTEGPEHTRATIVDEPEPVNDEAQIYEINLQTIRDGITWMLGPGAGKHTSEADVMTALRTNDAGMVDADGADLLVQAGLFKEVVYG